MRNYNLSIDNALHGIADLVRDRIGPAVNDPFAAQMARLSCILLRICANGLDDAAELRFEENAAIRSILKEASIILNGPLSRQLDVAGASTDPGLKISVLDEEVNGLADDHRAADGGNPAGAAGVLRVVDGRDWARCAPVAYQNHF